MPIRNHLPRIMTYQSALPGYGEVKVTPKRAVLANELDRVNQRMKSIVESGCDLYRLQDLSARACEIKEELRLLRQSQGYDVSLAKVETSPLTKSKWKRPKTKGKKGIK